MKNCIYLIVLGILFFSCQNNDTKGYFENCLYGQPEAIFNKEMEEVAKHEFKIKQKEGIENVQFTDGLELTIFQSGCDYIRQQFQFEMAAPSDTIDTNTTEYWVAQAINSFQKLGELGPQFFSYSSWAQAIAERAADFKLAEFLEVQPGFFVKIDRIESLDTHTLLITLSEEPETDI
jgi:hypothetical protein